MVFPSCYDILDNERKRHREDDTGHDKNHKDDDNKEVEPNPGNDSCSSDESLEVGFSFSKLASYLRFLYRVLIEFVIPYFLDRDNS